MIDRACVGISDPAEIFAVSVRIIGRLGWTHPDLARFFVGAGLDVADQPVGLAPAGYVLSKLGSRRFSALHARSSSARPPAACWTAEGAPGSLGRRRRELRRRANVHNNVAWSQTKL
jgi:hypothetical protein